MSHIFISYSTKNSNYAYRLADKLREEGFDVWIDNDELRSSENWWESIVRALGAADAFIVIMTPESRASRWVQREVTLADNWRKQSFPLLLDGENWEIYVLTQFIDIRNGQLPPPKFYQHLARYVERKTQGQVITTEPQIGMLDDTFVEEALANPPAQDESDGIPLSKRSNAIVIGSVLIILIGTIVIAGLFIRNQQNLSTQETRTALAIEATTTSEPVTNTSSPTIASDTPEPATNIPLMITPGGGGQIVFARGDISDRELYILDLETGQETRLTNNNADEISPIWSPDGSQIAFASNRDGNSNIYTMNADGSFPISLTTSGTVDYTPSWSPDGLQIAFYSYRDGSPEIFIMNADGRNSIRLTDNDTGDYAPSWSPDGSQIVFYSNRNRNNEIYIMDADGSNSVRLTDNEAGDYNPTWSPDGSQIAFYSYRDGNYEIYIMGADGSNPVRLTDNEAGDYNPTWSPDGSQIAFYSYRDGNYEIYVMNSDGSNQRRITNTTEDERFPDWRPVAD